MNKNEKDEREIYSIQDFRDILSDVLAKDFGWGYPVTEMVCNRIEKEFEYVNWIRFKRANCVGCVSDNDECDISYGRGDFRGVWQKIVDGEIQSCPVRTNGTCSFSAAEGFKQIDIADHKFNVVKPLEKSNDIKK